MPLGKSLAGWKCSATFAGKIGNALSRIVRGGEAFDGDDDRFVFAVQKFDEQDRAERVARKLMEKHEADRFERVLQSTPM
jgi:hypothetical protein